MQDQIPTMFLVGEHAGLDDDVYDVDDFPIEQQQLLLQQRVRREIPQSNKRRSPDRIAHPMHSKRFQTEEPSQVQYQQEQQQHYNQQPMDYHQSVDDFVRGMMQDSNNVQPCNAENIPDVVAQAEQPNLLFPYQNRLEMVVENNEESLNQHRGAIRDQVLASTGGQFVPQSGAIIVNAPTSRRTNKTNFSPTLDEGYPELVQRQRQQLGLPPQQPCQKLQRKPTLRQSVRQQQQPQKQQLRVQPTLRVTGNQATNNAASVRGNNVQMVPSNHFRNHAAAPVAQQNKFVQPMMMPPQQQRREPQQQQQQQVMVQQAPQQRNLQFAQPQVQYEYITQGVANNEKTPCALNGQQFRPQQQQQQVNNNQIQMPQQPQQHIVHQPVQQVVQYAPQPQQCYIQPQQQQQQYMQQPPQQAQFIQQQPQQQQQQQIPTTIVVDDQRLKFKSSFRTFNQKYIIQSLIGRGGQGCVYAGVMRDNHKPVAIKCLKNNQVVEWQIYGGNRVPGELAMHYKASNGGVDGIVKIYDFYSFDDQFLTVLERPEGFRDLSKHINEYGCLSEKQGRHVFSQLWNTMLAIHHNGVIHRDIKAENILYNPETSEIKLIDFGCAAFYQEKEFTAFAGTLTCYPPEYFVSSADVSKRSYSGVDLDIWCCALVLYITIEGRLPFSQTNDIVTKTISFKRPAITHLCRKFLGEMLVKDPKQRLTKKMVATHPVFNQILL